jgi:hypothetical protein
MYKPLSILAILFLFIFLFSCAPANYISKQGDQKETVIEKPITNDEKIIKNEKNELKQKKTKTSDYQKYKNLKNVLSENITVLISKKDDPKIVDQFLNIIELAIYKKKIKNIFFNIHVYENNSNLMQYLENNNKPGKIYFGPISTDDSLALNTYCDDGILFFSFSSNKSLADNCVFLLNFFPHNEIETIFEYLPENSKVAIVYPENSYGYKINGIVDSVSERSNSIIINRASYKENLENVRGAIKELGKYELRKFELNRQKKLLALNKDENSKKRLKKLERFTTTNDYDFTHVLIADYGVRLLQVAPLLAYYDIDPNIVGFIGTGAWDDAVFFNEPTLQNAIFPGVEYKKRQKLIEEYVAIYDESLMRVSTLPYDLIGLLNYLINTNYNLKEFYELIESKNFIFDGVDGNFYFKNNLIERELKILQIKNGKALQIN